MKHTNISMSVLALSMGIVAGAHASSHREAPFITEMPKVDGTDFYMFNSYEPARSDYVTLIANYLPFLQFARSGTPLTILRHEKFDIKNFEADIRAVPPGEQERHRHTPRGPW